MIIFLAKDATEIAEQLHSARSKGLVGLYRARIRDECTVRAAAALAEQKVLILNILLVRLSYVAIILGSSLMILPSTFDVAVKLFLCGLIASLVSAVLDNVGLPQ